ncbi:MAG: ornithine--oxo-acid transaminase, partial [Thermoplasmata archaeon]|nr:ornithine--oxo-acid transaminase [Thermoplasmata archaeon]
KYMDMLSAYSAVSHGHLHPHVIAEAKAQLDRLTLTSRAFYNDRLGPFLKRLCELAGMEMALPMNTGAEAVETAIKMARRYAHTKMGIPAGKGEIIVCDNNFHGRTTTIVGFSSDPDSKDGFGPFTPGFTSIPFNDLDAFQEAIHSETVGILVEPIQAEAGIFVPDPGYLKGLRDICNDRGILLMFDEIQTGLCRTGKMFASQYEDAKPDILTVGKAIGAGVIPLSAAISSREIMSVFTPGSHGSTFGGNPLACAVGEAAIDVLVDERMDERATELGAYLMDRLEDIRTPNVKEIRGKGLLVGIEIELGEGETVRPHCEKLMGMGLLCKDTHERTIRLAPPLTITREELDWAVERLAQVL